MFNTPLTANSLQHLERVAFGVASEPRAPQSATYEMSSKFKTKFSNVVASYCEARGGGTALPLLPLQDGVVDGSKKRYVIEYIVCCCDGPFLRLSWNHCVYISSRKA